MLPMLINTTMPWAPSTWNVWVEHIMKQRKVFSLRKAAIVRASGGTASATSGFVISDSEVKRIKAAFERPGDIESIRAKGKTYVMKTVDDRQLIAFNGAYYIIICRSKSLFVVVQCDSRDLSDEAGRWLRRVNARLMEKGF